MVEVIPQTDPLASLGQAAGAGLSSGLQMLMQQKMEGMQQQRQKAAAMEEYEDLLKRGFTPKEAGLWIQFTEGGKTHLAKEVLERMQRGGGLEAQGFPLQEEAAEGVAEEVSPGLQALQPQPEEEVEEAAVEIKEPGLTPKEQAARGLKMEERAFKRNEKYLQKQDEIRSALPSEKIALQQMRGALSSGDFNSRRNLVADLFGQEWLKTASAQTVNSATKTFLMAALKGMTGRPNQFIEKQITKALISPQYKDEANKLILEGLEGLHKLKKFEAEQAAALEEMFTSKGKEIPRNFQSIINKRVQKKADAFEKKYEKSLIKRLGIKASPGAVLVRTPDGELKQIPKSKIKAARAAGGEILNGS